MNVSKRHGEFVSEDSRLARKQLESNGFAHIAGFFSKSYVQEMRNEIAQLLTAEFNDGMGPLISFEAEHSDVICRMEYMVGASDVFKNLITEIIQPFTEQILGCGISLLKDKCNFKKPMGGGFGPHQDYLAYKNFHHGAHYNVAVYLDDATAENGVLEFIVGDKADVASTAIEQVQTVFGEKPVFPIDDGGEIIADIAQEFLWEPIYAKSGDIMFFDSLIPHQSPKNLSDKERKILFFTFVAEPEKSKLYSEYYAAKRANPHDPQFHIATPMKKLTD